jgi:hypothetical protein
MEIKNEVIDSWQKLCDEINKNGGLRIELTPEEVNQINRMYEIQKRSNDPNYWKNIILDNTRPEPLKDAVRLVDEFDKSVVAYTSFISHEGYDIDAAVILHEQLRKARQALLDYIAGIVK